MYLRLFLPSTHVSAKLSFFPQNFFNFIQNCEIKKFKMSQGVTLSEAEEKRERPPGFFPQLYENICKKLSK